MTGATAFAGFGAGATAWFEGLERDNSKAYFDATRATWEAEVREPLAALLAEAAETFGGAVRLFRQSRDTRFSRGGGPYKVTTYGVVAGRPGSEAGLYAELSKAGLYVAAGCHDLAPDQLRRFHAAVDDPESGAVLEAAVHAAVEAGLGIGGEALRTVPRGYRRDHPRAVLLRHRALVAGATLPPGPALATRAAADHAFATWRAALPLCAWLDAHVGPSEIPPEVRWGRGRAR